MSNRKLKSEDKQSEIIPKSPKVSIYKPNEETATKRKILNVESGTDDFPTRTEKKTKKEVRMTKKIKMEKLARARKELFKDERNKFKKIPNMLRDELPGGGSVSEFVKAFKAVEKKKETEQD